MLKGKIVLATLLFFCVSLFVVSADNTYASELNYVAMEQTANNLFLADRDEGKIYVFNNDNKGTLNKILTVGSSPTSMVVYHDYLLVALSKAQKIKVISTLTLTEVGEINTSKMPYWLALDGDKLYATASRNNGTDYAPFVMDLFVNNTIMASSTTVWPSTYPNFYMSGNEQILINPVNHTAYIGNLGYSPDNIKKYDISDFSNIQYLAQNSHGSLGSNGKQFIFNEDYSKIYFSAGGSEGYSLQVVNPDSLAKIADLALGSYPNSVAQDSSYVYAGKSAYYESGDIKVYSKANNTFIKDYSLPDGEDLVSAGLSSGQNLYAASNKYLYLLDKNSSKITKIYDFINNQIVDNSIKEGDLIKADGSSLYQLNNNKRDVVPFSSGYEAYKGAVVNSRSLNEGAAKVVLISELTSYQLGKNLTVKPNSNYLLKKQNEEKYYLVSSEATLTEVNKNNYSNYFLVMIPDIFFTNYSVNEEVVPSYSINVSKTGTGSGTVFEGSVLEDGSVINCGSKCSASFLRSISGTPVTLTASPSNGSVFTSWTGCGSNTTDPVCTVQMNENKNITANFSISNTNTSNKTFKISPNTGSSEMKSATTAYISWSTNIEPEYCGVDYGLFYGLSPSINGGGKIGGDLVQFGTAANDGQFYYVVNLTNLQSDKDYYYRVVCNLKGVSTVYQSDVKKLSKYGTVTSPVTAVSTKNITNNSVLVEWVSSNSDISYLLYGAENSANGINNVVKNDVSTKNHSLPIRDLKPNTKYYFVVQSNSLTSLTLESEVFSFTTESSVVTSDPISNVNVKNITTTSANIGWTSINSDISRLVYGTENSDNGINKEMENSLSSKEHSVLMSGLKPNTKYYYIIYANSETDSAQNAVVYKYKSGVREFITKSTLINDTNLNDVLNNETKPKTTTNTNPSVSNSDDSAILKLQRKISELENKVIELEKKATQLDQKFADKYAGTMFLDVENQGRLWYVDPTSKNRYYFENGESALSIGSKLATGISYEDIQKIPVGVPDKLYNLTDSDGDGLPDNLEVALGLNPNKADTDGDGYNDKAELSNGYNPASNQKYVYNKALVSKLEGKMLLQVSGPNSHGEIWYISKGKRWYGGTQDSMYEIMKAKSLGATPENIRKIEVGGVSGTN